MRKDQIFVLMLVIFLPLTGCFGDAIGEAEADEGTEEELISGTTTVNKIITIQLAPNEEINMTLNGTTLEFVSSWRCDGSPSYCETNTNLMFDMNCDDPQFHSGAYFFNKVNWFTPNYAGMECVMTIDNDYNDRTMTYSFIEHPLA